MGNIECGSLCNNPQDKKQIIQIQVPSRYDPSDFNQDEEKTTIPLQVSSSQMKQNQYALSIKKNNRKIKNQLQEWVGQDQTQEALNFELPIVEVKMEQKHFIVPHSLVASRVNQKLALLLKKELPTSPLTENDSRWYLLKSGNYYSGQLKDQCTYGIGTYILPDKIFYGQTKDTKPEGMGVILSNTYVFKGQFEKGKAEGEATIQSQNCNIKGFFKQGFIVNGRVSTKQFIYQGQFVNNQPSGKGIYRTTTDIIYEGQFRDGKFQGVGTYTCPDYEYKGSFRKGLKDGEGVINFPNQQIKIRRGVWAEDKLIKEI